MYYTCPDDMGLVGFDLTVFSIPYLGQTQGTFKVMTCAMNFFVRLIADRISLEPCIAWADIPEEMGPPQSSEGQVGCFQI
mmetsp:Transcript_2980/g.6056  ORF Transcript_2980/g.6056 Transcript_2980/m.6056 type:complete len:80 (-) Transcript_2980:156-395(-)